MNYFFLKYRMKYKFGLKFFRRKKIRMRAFIIFCLLFSAAIAVPLEITTGKYCLLCRQIINGLEEFTKMSKETIEEVFFLFYSPLI